MNLSKIVEEREQKIFQQGLQQKQQEVVENLLMIRFNVIDEALSQIVESLIKLPSNESLRLIL